MFSNQGKNLFGVFRNRRDDWWERFWDFRGGLIVFVIGLLILPDPVIFWNKDSNVVEEINTDFSSNSDSIIYWLYDLKQIVLWTWDSAGTHNPQIPMA